MAAAFAAESAFFESAFLEVASFEVVSFDGCSFELAKVACFEDAFLEVAFIGVFFPRYIPRCRIHFMAAFAHCVSVPTIAGVYYLFFQTGVQFNNEGVTHCGSLSKIRAHWETGGAFFAL
jgi:hypothetical protein